MPADMPLDVSISMASTWYTIQLEGVCGIRSNYSVTLLEQEGYALINSVTLLYRFVLILQRL
jgi:hypothetical protein